MTQQVLTRGVRRGDGVFGDMRQTSATRIMAPATYATLVAEDRHLAFECAQLSAVGATSDALHVVAEAADTILARYEGMVVITPTGESESFVEALRNVARVGQRSDELGDEVQATWCTLLHHRLVGREWPPA
jgi:hypothetical protein